MIKESEAVYNYEQVWDKLNNFNKIALTAYSFIKHFSLRTGHIELWGKHGFINIYVDSAPDSSLRAELIKQIFSEITENKWTIKNLEIAFEKEIKITIDLGDIVGN